jgi:triosephosphate isomerase
MAGNWKMYKTAAETKTFFDQFRPSVDGVTDREIVICPPFVNLTVAIDCAANGRIEIGGQNCFWEKEGAYTGEVAAGMLAALGAKWVLIGHSERRQYFGETDETVMKRTVAALSAGLNPIVCVGERLEERESDRTKDVLKAQFEGGIARLSPEQFEKIVIAYEPVWAIGTGKTATPDIAEDAHEAIREVAENKFGAGAAAKLRILYGGSVKPDNTKALMGQSNIDGVLVGGASLDPNSFASIVKY